MSNCNCKKDLISDNLVNNQNLGEKFLMYSLKIFAFLVFLIFSPVVILVIYWFVFKTLVLNKDVNIKPLLLSIGKKFQFNEDDYDGVGC